MKDFAIEMCYGFNVCLVVEANNEEEAIEKAKQIVIEEVAIDEGLVNCTDIEFEQVTYIESEDK